MADDERAIRQLIEDWALAVRRKDMDGILRHHVPGLVVFDVPPPLQTDGLDAYRDGWTPFYTVATDPPVFELEGLDVTAGQDVAFARAILRCAMTGMGEFGVRMTVGLRKLDGQWTVVHEHHSVPAEG